MCQYCLLIGVETMRSPSISAPRWEAPIKNTETLELTIKVITPMFGGSATPREVDKEFPVRASSIRGHLRFWWRALYGGLYSTPGDLFKAESELWGSATKTLDNKEIGGPGKVSLIVKVIKPGEKFIINKLPTAHPYNGPKIRYFAFPFEKSKIAPEVSGVIDLEFNLLVILRFTDPSNHQDILYQIINTIKLWIAFGGIGSRTRRGCGTLTVTTDHEKWLPKNRESLCTWFNELIPPHGNKYQDISLIGTKLVIGNTSDALQSLEKLATFWANFRKGHLENGAYSSGCMWNDLHVIQKRVRNSSSSQQIKLSKPFFGLPLIYHEFQNVSAVTITTNHYDRSGRMASPIILKPISFSENCISPLIATLNTKLPNSIFIGNQKYSLISPKPSEESVLYDLKRATNPLIASITFAERIFEQNHFTIGEGQ